MKLYYLALGTALVVCVGCTGGRGVHHQKFDNGQYVAPPAAMMQRPGPMVDGPGPGVLSLMAHPNVMSAGGAAGPYGIQGSSQVKFTGPAGMMIGWQAGQGFADAQLVAPGRYDFMQGSTYQLKFGSIPRREAMTVYPTLEVRPGHPTTQAYLAHNSIPVEITADDLDQVESNNFVTKVIYLPDARHQELAIAGVETLVSTQLSPGADPVSEAERRGTIMAILRMGNKDLQMGSGSTGSILQASYNGEAGEFAAPTPIASAAMTGGGGGNGMMGPGPMPGGMIPQAAIMAGAGAPGAPGGQTWGMPITGTPIGLPGPPHLPLGGPASLKSHTVRNLTEVRLPEPVDHMLFDVKHEPGYSLPAPVKHVQYTEKNPVFKAGEVSYPATQVPTIVGPYASGSIAGSGGRHHRR